MNIVLSLYCSLVCVSLIMPVSSNLSERECSQNEQTIVYYAKIILPETQQSVCMYVCVSE